jgi:hypothetical protein
MDAMKSKMDQQTDLLKLIVQKMEIKNKDDDYDDLSFENNKTLNQWSSALNNIRLKTSVLQKFKS